MRFRRYNVNTLVETLIRTGGAILLLHFVRSPLRRPRELRAWADCRRGRDRDRVRARIDWREVSRLTIPMVILMLAIAIFQNADVLAVKRWLSPTEAGLYGAASAMARGFGVVFVPLYVLAGPLLTGAHESGRPIRGLTLHLAGVFSRSA